MNKKYKLQGLNCPVCCAKIEDEIKHMKGVNSCEINLLNQDMNIDMKYDLTPKIKKIIKSIEPEVNLIYIDDEVLNNKNHHIFNIIKLILGGFIYLLALILNFTVNIYWLHLSLYIISYIILGYDVVFCAIKNIIHGKIFDEHFLMSISTIGAFLIKEFEEGVAVMLFYQIGEFFEDLAVEKSRKNIKSLLNLRPDWVKIEKNNEIITISPKDAKIGEIMIVKPGEKIALDGIIVSGCGDIDTKAITGESLLKKVDVGKNTYYEIYNK